MISRSRMSSPTSCRTSAVAQRTPADASPSLAATHRAKPLSHRRMHGHPAMGAGVNAAAVWRERTGQSQDLSVDLRQAVYAVAPWARFLVEELRALGMLPGDPLPAEWTWQPSLNGRSLQAPLAIGNPLSFAIFETRDGRRVTPTGLYPQHFVGFLRVIDAAPDTASIAAAVRTFDSADLENRVGEAGMIMGIHRTQAEWLAHPQGQAVAATPLVEIVKVGDSDPVPWTPSPSQPLSGIACSPAAMSLRAPRSRAIWLATAPRCCTSRATRASSTRQFGRTSISACARRC